MPLGWPPMWHWQNEPCVRVRVYAFAMRGAIFTNNYRVTPNTPEPMARRRRQHSCADCVIILRMRICLFSILSKCARARMRQPDNTNHCTCRDKALASTQRSVSVAHTDHKKIVMNKKRASECRATPISDPECDDAFEQSSLSVVERNEEYFANNIRQRLSSRSPQSNDIRVRRCRNCVRTFMNTLMYAADLRVCK